MDDLKRILDKAEVPDPGEGYWASFSNRVDSALPPAGNTAWSAVRRKGALFAASAAAGLLIAFVMTAIMETGSKPETIPVKRVISESRRTVTLAADADKAHVLMVLNSSAAEKSVRAREACDEGRWDSVAPLARSWEKILKRGLAASIDKAVDNDEDVQVFLPQIKRTLMEGAARFREIAAAADSSPSEEVLSAIEASEDLMQTIDERFGKSRG